MAQTSKEAPTAGDLEDQIKIIRDELSKLAATMAKLSEAKASSTAQSVFDEADDLLGRLRHASEKMAGKAKEKADSIEDHIAERPIQSALIALLVGILIGSISRR